MGQFTQLNEDLAIAIGQERIKTDQAFTARYSFDGLSPRAVVFPKDIRQVKEIVSLAAKAGVSMIPWGSGTKKCMGATPSGADIVVSTEKMNHMLDVDVANLTITVEAGVKFRDIQARLATQEDRCYLPLEELGKESDELICSDRAHSGCFLPLDPPFSDRATIGGIIATNSSGPRRLLYGLPRDLLLGVRFVTPEGEIVGAGGKTVKNVSGYDVSKLMIGSYGTLGILCEMTLRLLPLPERMETLVFEFPSISEAGSFAEAMLRTKLLPAALEIMNSRAFEAVGNRAGIYAKTGSCLVMVALEGFEEAVERMKKEMLAAGDRLGANTGIGLKEDKHNPLWLAVGNIQTFNSDKNKDLVALKLTYPLSEWKEIYAYCQNLIAGEGLKHTILCHAGSGVSLINLLPEDRRERDSTVGLVSGLRDKCREKGGNLVVECAPPDLKKRMIVWGNIGGAGILMERLRNAIDPSGIMNPGRFFPTN
ncbi:MAG: FAD-binding oxidoreductase [Desulfobacteraceae bacterium]|nr:MAG: FAD-binding oxidoreductase [Desulfobacteraceae bacterium]